MTDTYQHHYEQLERGLVVAVLTDRDKHTGETYYGLVFAFKGGDRKVAWINADPDRSGHG